MHAFMCLWKYCCGFNQYSDETPNHAQEAKPQDASVLGEGTSQFTFAGPSASSIFTFAPYMSSELAKAVAEVRALQTKEVHID